MTEGKRELHALREQVAQLDRELLELLDGRARLSRQLGALRKDSPPTLPLTDRATLRELVSHSTGDMPEQSLREILAAVFGACLSLELPVSVAFAGPLGGFAHAAARGRFGPTASLGALASTAEALDAISRKSSEFAVVPFETSDEGPVQATIAALIASDLRVVEVLDASIDLHLFTRSGQDAVRKVYAAAADAALCARFFDGLSPKPVVVDTPNAVVACQQALAEEDAGAIANEACGLPFGLHVARRSVVDVAGGRVRYAVVGTRPAGRTGHEMTAFVFSVHDAPGSLLDVLKVFAERGIHLTKIHSQPAQGHTWAYLFCAETAGHFTDRPLVIAFEDLKRVARSFKLLGSYAAP